MALWLIWKNHFVKTIDYMEKYFKKKKYNINVVFYPKQIVESQQINQNIYHYEIM